jgi:hypothetical protein
MKCIKNTTTGEIRRVGDVEAYKLETKGWGYVPKSEWKSATRTVSQPKSEKQVNPEGKPRREREKKNKR